MGIVGVLIAGVFAGFVSGYVVGGERVRDFFVKRILMRVSAKARFEVMDVVKRIEEETR